MKSIAVSNGRYVAVVDDEDFELVSRYRWWARKQRGTTYATTQIQIGRNKRITIGMHRLIIGGDSQHVDHRNQDGLDNRKENLRPCTAAQNGQNRKIQKHSSKFKGVSFNRATSKWTAAIKRHGKRAFLGYFESEQAAACAYDRAAEDNFGEFARTNLQMGVL